MDREDRIRADRLKPALVGAMTSGLASAGWRSDLARDIDGVPYTVAVLRRPVVDQFTAVMELAQTGPWTKGDPPLFVGLTVKVDYEPAYRLFPALANRASYGECWIDAGELLDPPQILRAGIRAPGDAATAVQPFLSVAPLAIAYVQQHASVDAMLGSAASEPELVHEEVISVPVLLASAGRHAEAVDALDRYLASGIDEVQTAAYQAFVVRLRTWIDAGGISPAAPTEPVNPRRPMSDLDAHPPITLRAHGLVAGLKLLLRSRK